MPAMIFAVTGLGSSTVSFSVKKTAESMTKVVAPTIANLMSSWCRSKYGRIGLGSRAIVASVKDTTGQCTEIGQATRTRAGRDG